MKLLLLRYLYALELDDAQVSRALVWLGRACVGLGVVGAAVIAIAIMRHC